jgi:hypothetical protein
MMDITQEELIQIIGELYVSRGRLKVAYDQAMMQIDEMAKVITQLRAEIANGKLVEPSNNDSV